MDRQFAALGSLSGALAVALGAFGAHALRERLSAEALATFETGVRYHFYHVAALLAVAVAVARWTARGAGLARAAGWCFLAGSVLFSGSLYLLALTGVRWLGAVTPLGGVALIAGWLSLAAGAWRGAAAGVPDGVPAGAGKVAPAAPFGNPFARRQI